MTEPMKAFALDNERKVEITGAILLYGSSAATIHEVRFNEGVPSIQPGQPITAEHLRAIISGLAVQETLAPKPQSKEKEAKNSRSLDLGILPTNVLLADVGRLVFWVEASRRPLFFSGKNLRGYRTKKVRHPALIFDMKVGSGVSVFAIRSSRRPNADTKLYQAPYYNVYDSGSICLGSAPFPKTPHPKFIDQCIEAFFLTEFTHQSSKRKLVNKGTYIQYLKAMGRGKDPRGWLVDLNITFGNYLAQVK